jgi:hypothetical protein
MILISPKLIDKYFFPRKSHANISNIVYKINLKCIYSVFAVFINVFNQFKPPMDALINLYNNISSTVSVH